VRRLQLQRLCVQHREERQFSSLATRQRRAHFRHGYTRQAPCSFPATALSRTLCASPLGSCKFTCTLALMERRFVEARGTELVRCEPAARLAIGKLDLVLIAAVVVGDDHAKIMPACRRPRRRAPRRSDFSVRPVNAKGSRAARITASGRVPRGRAPPRRAGGPRTPR